MNGVIATIPRFQFSNALGVPLAGGTLATYLAGTTTPAKTYQDQALTIENTNPVKLDARGECVLWLDPAKSYKFVLKSLLGVTQWTQDNVSGALGSNGERPVQSETLIAAADQTVFALKKLSYTPGIGSLQVYVDGFRLFPGDYIETDSATVTLKRPLAQGQEVLFEAGSGLNSQTSLDAAMTPYRPAVGPATNVAAALDSLNVDTMHPVVGRTGDDDLLVLRQGGINRVLTMGQVRVEAAVGANAANAAAEAARDAAIAAAEDAQLSSSTKTYLTYGAMAADAAQAAATQGRVTSDPDEAKNGYYVWDGSAWLRSKTQPASSAQVKALQDHFPTPGTLDMGGTASVTDEGGDLVVDSHRVLFGKGADVGLVIDYGKKLVEIGNGDSSIAIDYGTKEIRTNMGVHVDGEYEETDTRIVELSPGAPAALTIGSRGAVALQVDTKNRRLLSDFEFVEPTREPIPSVIYVDEPPVIFFDTTDPANSKRGFQAIPAIARTGKRLWCAFFGGISVQAMGEYPGDFVILSRSDNKGATWAEYCYLRFPDVTKRCFDQQLWTDPSGALWVIFTVSGNNQRHDPLLGTWAAVCDNPEAEFPGWCRPFRLSYYGWPGRVAEIGGVPYLSIDYRMDDAGVQRLAGKRLHRLDWIKRRVEMVGFLPDSLIGDGYYETCIAPLRDGRVLAQWRTPNVAEYCVGDSIRGPWSAPQTWTAALGATLSARRCLFRTSSGRIGIVYNQSTGGVGDRTNMRLAISEDGGQTFPFAVMLDTRPEISYPSVALDGDTIYIAYDRQRGIAGEIICCSVRESDVLRGAAAPVITSISFASK